MGEERVPNECDCKVEGKKRKRDGEGVGRYIGLFVDGGMDGESRDGKYRRRRRLVYRSNEESERKEREIDGWAPCVRALAASFFATSHGKAWIVVQSARARLGAISKIRCRTVNCVARENFPGTLFMTG